jgi:hypothetical protein
MRKPGPLIILSFGLIVATTLLVFSLEPLRANDWGRYFSYVCPAPIIFLLGCIPLTRAARRKNRRKK